MTNYQALNSRRHASIKIAKDPCYSHAGSRQLLPISIDEVALASAHYPIVFVKHPDTGRFVMAALVGLQSGENLFGGSVGWGGAYIPFEVRNYPLMALASEHDAEQLVVCVDEDSELSGSEQGQALFTEEGDPSAWLNQLISALTQHHQRRRQTEQAIEQMLALDLLTARTLTVQSEGGQEHALSGFYGIDEQKLNQLGSADFVALRDKGLLAVVYAILLSSLQVASLARQISNKAAQGADNVCN